MDQATSDTASRFDNKVWRTVGIVAISLIILWVARDTARILLLILTACLLAIFFNRLAGIIERKARLSRKWSMAAAIIGSLLLLVLLFWFIGAKAQVQIAELSDTLPASLEKAKAAIGKNPIGARIMEGMGGSGGGGLQKVAPAAQRFFTTSFGVLGDLYAILFLGIFFTISPKIYIEGVIRLFPAKARAGASHVLKEIGVTLGHWLKGQLIAMLVVAVLTWIGLAILGVPMAIALAIIAGLFNFVPNLGPLIAMIPAVLVGMMQGGNTALLVAGLYLLVQALESNLITPYIQNKMIEIPPALILMGQLLIGTLFGVIGIVLATPLVAILMVVVRELYVKKQESREAPALSQNSSHEKPGSK